MTPKYNATTIAHFAIDKCTKENNPISNLQLQKILYILQISYFGTFNRFLFNDEFEAWQYGPVIPKIYAEYVDNAGQRIKKEYSSTEFDCISTEDKSLISQAVDILRDKDPWSLVEATHRKGEPWHETWNNGLGNHTIIANRLLVAAYGKR